MTIDELNEKHKATIDAMRKHLRDSGPGGPNWSSATLRAWCLHCGVKNYDLLSLDDALTEAGKLLAPKPDPLPPMPWAKGNGKFENHIVFDAKENFVAEVPDASNNHLRHSILRYIASCGTQDVRLIVESGLAPVIAEALRERCLYRCSPTTTARSITLPESKR